jgi:hypothetical protein
VNFREALSAIESHAFSARINIASDLSGMLVAARSEKAVSVVWSELNSKERGAELLRRVRDLSSQAVDFRYRNDWDDALAIYFWLLSLSNPEQTDIAAEQILRAPQCYWAAQMARRWAIEGRWRAQSGSVTTEAAPALGLQGAEFATPAVSSDKRIVLSGEGLQRLGRDPARHEISESRSAPRRSHCGQTVRVDQGVGSRFTVRTTASNTTPMRTEAA